MAYKGRQAQGGCAFPDGFNKEGDNMDRRRDLNGMCVECQLGVYGQR